MNFDWLKHSVNSGEETNFETKGQEKLDLLPQ